MDIYFCNFFQGLPFVVLITFLFVTKRECVKASWFHFSFPTVLYFVLVFLPKLQDYLHYFLYGYYNEYDFDVPPNTILENIGFSLWLLYLMRKDYTTDVINETIKKMYLKKTKQGKYKFEYGFKYRSSFLNLVEDITREMWYIFIPEKDKHFLVRNKVNELFYKV